MWEVNSGFSIAEYASATERSGIPSLGLPTVQQDFAREPLDQLTPLVGDWVCRSGYLTCADVTDSWPRIRTKRPFRDVFVSFRLYRKERNTCNWAGVALRTDEECLGRKESRIRVSVQKTQQGDELLVFPTDWARFR